MSSTGSIFPQKLEEGDSGTLRHKTKNGYIVLQRDDNGKAQLAFVKELPKMGEKDE